MATPSKKPRHTSSTDNDDTPLKVKLVHSDTTNDDNDTTNDVSSDTINSINSVTINSGKKKEQKIKVLPPTTPKLIMKSTFTDDKVEKSSFGRQRTPKASRDQKASRDHSPTFVLKGKEVEKEKEKEREKEREMEEEMEERDLSFVEYSNVVVDKKTKEKYSVGAYMI